MEQQIEIINESGDEKILWEKYGKPAYEKGLQEGRNESGLYAIIPMSILENKSLSANAKLLYGEIMALSKKSGKCYATNEYMADVLGLSKRSMPSLLQELSGIGLIMVSINRSKKGTYRDIIVSFFADGGHRCITRGGVAKQRRGASLSSEVKREIDKVEINKDTLPGAKAPDEKKQKVYKNPIDKDIEELIFLFKDINPAYNAWFGRKAQRNAIERLVIKMSRHKVEEIIEMLAITNKMRYAPSITTPAQLENKIGSWLVFYQREKLKVEANKPFIV